MKRILITGATGGIGSELVRLYTSHNYFVLAFGTNIEKLNLLKDKYKDNIEVFSCDMKSKQEIQSTFEKYEADTDGDGQSNGLELGDPSCCWTEGGTPPITDDLSHPGKADSKTSREASADKVECPDSGAVFSKQLHGMAFSLTFLSLFFIL